jgi:hypothetical protein
LTIAEVRNADEAREATARAGGYAAIAGGVVASLAGAIADASRIPYLEITDAAEHTPDGRYRLTPLRPDPSSVAWHSSLRRYGAAELNARFLRMTQRKMDSDSWTAWLSMKIILEASLNEREIASLRFDGHKGIPLGFDSQRVLQQPLYRVDADGNLLDR